MLGPAFFWRRYGRLDRVACVVARFGDPDRGHRLMRLVYLVMLLLFTGAAQAQTVPVSDTHTDKASAWSHCQSNATAAKGAPGSGGQDHQCVWISTFMAQVQTMSGSRVVYTGITTDHQATAECTGGLTWYAPTNQCVGACTAGETFTAQTRASAKPGSCNPTNYCTVAWTKNGAPYVVVGSDGVAVSWQQWSGVSTAGAHCTLEVDSDGDGTKDSEDAKPTDPTESKDTDGDGLGDNIDFNPTDPDNGQDNGTGNESDNTSSGGGTCTSPPSSSGDAIAANIAYQTWATRCAVERLNAATTGNGTGGSGSTDLTATNAKLDGIKGAIDGLTNLDGADVNDGLGDGTGEPEPGSVMKETEHLAEGFDMSGFGWGNTCPAIPSFTVKGYTIQLDPNGVFCDFMILGGWFVLIVMSLKCLRMLGAA